MKLTLKFPKTYFRQIIYILIILLPPIMTSNIYSTLDKENTTSKTLNGLFTLSNVMYLNMQDSQRDFNYILKLLTTTDEFKLLNVSGISRLVGEFCFNNDAIQNVYVMNTKNEVLYGIDNNLLSSMDYKGHINSALSGKPSFYTDYINNEGFLQISYPIFSEPNPNEVVGIVVLTYNLETISRFLETVTTSSPSIKAYIIDDNGNVIAQSTQHSLVNAPTRVDINQIKLALDYDPAHTFKLTDETLLNGAYYSLDTTTGWTLLVTIPYYEGLQVADLLSWIMGLLGAGSISTTEIIRNRNRTLKCLKDALVEPASDTETSSLTPPSQ